MAVQPVQPVQWSPWALLRCGRWVNRNESLITLKAVNGKSVEGLPYQMAVQRIVDAGATPKAALSLTLVRHKPEGRRTESDLTPT